MYGTPNTAMIKTVVRVEDHRSKAASMLSSKTTDDTNKRSLEGMDLFENIATLSIQTKEAARCNRCRRCWHDQTMRW